MEDLTLDALTLRLMADKFGELDLAIKRLAQERDRIKAQLIDSGESVITGSLYRVNVRFCTVTTLDSAAVKAALPPAVLAGCLRTTDSVRVSVTRVA